MSIHDSMQNIFALGLLAASLSAVPALADSPDQYRETQLGLYVDAQQAHALMRQNNSAVLIDVRDPIEIKFTGFATPTDIHVPWLLADREHFNAEAQTWPMTPNVDFSEQVRAQLEEQDVAKDAPIIVMCRSGSTRSAPAADAIHEMGYSEVYSVTDGFEGSKLEEGDSAGVRGVSGWRNGGLPWSYRVDPDVAWQSEK